MFDHLSDESINALISEYESGQPPQLLTEKYGLSCNPRHLHRYLPPIPGPSCEHCGETMFRRATANKTAPRNYACPECDHNTKPGCACPACVTRFRSAQIQKMPAAQALLDVAISTRLPPKDPEPPNELNELELLDACTIKALDWCISEVGGLTISPQTIQRSAVFPSARLRDDLLPSMYSKNLIRFCVTEETVDECLHELPPSSWPFIVNYDAVMPILSRIDQVVRLEREYPNEWLEQGLPAWHDIVAGDCRREFEFICASAKWSVPKAISDLSERIFRDLCARNRDDFVVEGLHSAINITRGNVGMGYLDAEQAPSEVLRLCINQNSEQRDRPGKYAKPQGGRRTRASLLRQMFGLLNPGEVDRKAKNDL